eukprot:1160677-Pelagomonas_calceolata.AAC.11
MARMPACSLIVFAKPANLVRYQVAERSMHEKQNEANPLKSPFVKQASKKVLLKHQLHHSPGVLGGVDSAALAVPGVGGSWAGLHGWTASGVGALEAALVGV